MKSSLVSHSSFSLLSHRREKELIGGSNVDDDLSAIVRESEQLEGVLESRSNGGSDRSVSPFYQPSAIGSELRKSKPKLEEIGMPLYLPYLSRECHYRRSS